MQKILAIICLIGGSLFSTERYEEFEINARMDDLIEKMNEMIYELRLINYGLDSINYEINHRIEVEERPNSLSRASVIKEPIQASKSG